MSDSVVIIPTFNERQNVERMTRKVMSLPKDIHILYVDDDSPDGTASIIEELMAEFPGRIYLEKRKEKLGLGTAYIHGFKWALLRNYEYIFEMDCDFSHSPDDLIRLYNTCAMEGVDVSIGSRYTRGGKVKNWPFKRIMLSYFASIYVRMILWIPLRDTTSGFKCYRAQVLRTIHLDGNSFRGYAFQICMKYAAFKHGFCIKEIPITFIDREYGESKMSTSIFKEAFWGVWKMRKMHL